MWLNEFCDVHPDRLTPKRRPALFRLFFVVPPPRFAELRVWIEPPNAKLGSVSVTRDRDVEGSNAVRIGVATRSDDVLKAPSIPS